jgi:hypothetical protein
MGPETRNPVYKKRHSGIYNNTGSPPIYKERQTRGL